MDDKQGDGRRRRAAEELILRTIAAHAESLLRTARRHSICVDDAQDAYQRAIEIFMAHAQRLDQARAPGWLHVVVKREAQAIRQSRQKLLMTTEVDLDGHEAHDMPTPEERRLSFDMVSRGAEGLKRLKPHELRALWLRAQGHSYNEIGAITGWSYSKVNRCLTEGRHAFLERYEGIESGAECARWLPVISAMGDGEASPAEILELRPHLRNCAGCRATLKALQDSSKPLAALLPVPLVVLDVGTGEQLMNVLMRVYEGFAGGLQERAVHSATKAQALIEASASGKVAAVAASAAAVAGGGYASVERVVERPAVKRTALKAPARPKAPVKRAVAPVTAAMPVRMVSNRPRVVPAKATPVRRRTESGARRTTRPKSRFAPEFRPKGRVHAALARRALGTNTAPLGAKPTWTPPAQPPPPPKAAPEFAPKGAAPEFGP